MPSTSSFSLVGLFLQADPVVKGVMVLLLAASVGVWTVAIDRAVRLRRLRREVGALDALSRRSTLAAGSDGLSDGFSGEVLRTGIAAGRELGHATRAERQDGAREAMRMALTDRLRPLEPGLPFLATIGSAAPFVGLFGTVWGIMSSFASIAGSNDTSLAIVAPGIAEALLSTAIGLAAAIPAVVAYNRLVTDLGRSRSLALSAVARIAARLSVGDTETLQRAAE